MDDAGLEYRPATHELHAKGEETPVEAEAVPAVQLTQFVAPSLAW